MKKLVVLSMLALMMSSCIISLHPLYDSKTMVKEMRLTGRWLDQNSESPSKWNFQAKKDNEGEFTGKYQLEHTSDGYTYEYEAVLLKLGADFYLDVLVEGMVDEKKEDQSPLLALYVPSHNFYKIEFGQTDQIKVFPFDGDRLDKLVSQRKIRIKHEMVDGTMVVTASTEDLQKFLLKYAQDKDAFDEPLLIQKTVD